jgi:hypothetical protein
MLALHPAGERRERPGIAPTMPANTAQSDPAELLRTADLPLRYAENGASDALMIAILLCTFMVCLLATGRPAGLREAPGLRLRLATGSPLSLVSTRWPGEGQALLPAARPSVVLAGNQPERCSSASTARLTRVHANCWRSCRRRGHASRSRQPVPQGPRGHDAGRGDECRG